MYVVIKRLYKGVSRCYSVLSKIACNGMSFTIISTYAVLQTSVN